MYGQKIGYKSSFENEGGEEMEVRGAWQAIVHGVSKESDMTDWMSKQPVFIYFKKIFSVLYYVYHICVISSNSSNHYALGSLDLISKKLYADCCFPDKELAFYWPLISFKIMRT